MDNVIAGLIGAVALVGAIVFCLLRMVKLADRDAPKPDRDKEEDDA